MTPFVSPADDLGATGSGHMVDGNVLAKWQGTTRKDSMVLLIEAKMIYVHLLLSLWPHSD